MLTSNKLKNKKFSKTNWPLTILLLFLAIVFILGPLYLTVLIALKDPSDMQNVLSWPKTIRWENFVDAWNMTDFPVKFRNTLFITVINLIFTIITNSMVAYVICRKRNKSKIFNMIYYYFVSAMFVPFNVIMLPLVKQASTFNLDNAIGITIIYIIFGLPQNIFLYSGFIKKITYSLR